MKKFIYALLICFLLPSIGQTAYLIKLKNKGSYTVHQYWEEGNTIVFNAYGGRIAIPKEKIESITDLDEGSGVVKDLIPETAPEPEEIAVEPAPSPPKPAAEKEGGAPATPTEITEKSTLDPEAAKGYMDQKISLVEWLKKHIADLKQGIEKKKDNNWIERRKTMISKVRAKIEALGREVAEKNSGVLPGWWNNIPVPADPVVPAEESAKP